MVRSEKLVRSCEAFYDTLPPQDNRNADILRLLFPDMSDGVVFEGRDEPSRGADDHSELLSTLDSHDLAETLDVSDVDNKELFDFDSTSNPGETFPQSVASGGPTPTGVILWTRIAPKVFDVSTPLAVQVANDERFEDVVYERITQESRQIRAHDYTVKIDLDGHLNPNHEYCYRFIYGDTASRTGHCQTLPPPGRIDRFTSGRCSHLPELSQWLLSSLPLHR